MKADVDELEITEIMASGRKKTIYEKRIKRVIDFILSLGGLVLFVPLYIILAIAIYIDDPGPILFAQKRIGQNKKYFYLHKFRSMKVSTPPDVPTHLLENPAQYVTGVGKFLRKYSLDELPQIWDIFVGHMSIVGPRPALWNQEDLIAERDKYGANEVKPGLTGWAQINGRDELEIAEKARFDGEYVKELNKSSLSGFRMDLKCFFVTISKVINHEGVVESDTGEIHKCEEEFVENVKQEPFSVLMSVYAKEKAEYLDLALKSNLVDQTYMPDEFIMICDGPLTEELDDVINSYEKRFPEVFRVYRTEKNQGLAEALNLGLTKCTYDLVARSDSDDVCSPNRFEVQTRYMGTHPEIDIVSSYIDEFDEDWRKPRKKKTMPLTNDELYKMAKFRNPINHMAVMYRKNVILEIGAYHQIPCVEDYELWVRALIKGHKLANIDQFLVHARVGNGMVKRRSNKEYINSWRELSNYMMKNGMIGKREFIRNMIAIRCFIYMPVTVKETIYKKILRK